MQYVFNSACLVLIGFILEATGMSFAQMAAIYFGSSVGGILFGAVCSSDLCVGCDVGYFGFTSALVAAVIVNWKALEPLGMCRLCLLLMMVGFFVLLVLFTVPSTLRTVGRPGWEYYNQYGHIGSFLCGLFLGLMFIRRARAVGRVQEKSFEKICFMVGAGGVALFFGLMITIWFTVANPFPYPY